MQVYELKNNVSAKDLLKGRKRPVTDWEKIFAYHMYDKGLVYAVYSKISKLKCQWRRYTDGKRSYVKMFNIISY